MIPTETKKRDSGLRKKFGISLDQYQNLSEVQNNVCFICRGTDEFSKHLAVDHCHKTGTIRGLLCRNYNRALGKFQDQVDYLERAIVYLKRTPPELGDPGPRFETKPHADRARYYCRVFTPDGDFASYKDAADYYGVHHTTVRDWCVGKRKKGIGSKPGFSSEKIFGVKE